MHFITKAICLPFSVIITLDDPSFCPAQQSEANSAFNIPAIIVVFLAALLVWKLFDMWSQSALGFLVVVIDGEWYVLYESWISEIVWGARTGLPLWVDGMFLVVIYSAGVFASMIEQREFAQWQIWHDSCQKDKAMSVFTLCICVILQYICVHVRALLMTRVLQGIIFVCCVTGCCSALQHSLRLVGWLL